MQKPPPPPPQQQQQQQQLLVKHEPMSFDEQQIKTEAHDDSLNESINTIKTRSDPYQSVPPHVLEQIDEVINDVISGAGMIPQEVSSNTHPSSTPVQIVPLTQPKIQPQHMITTHHPYIQQQQQIHEWSNYQQQPTLNIAAMRGPPSYTHYHSQQQQHHHDLLPATTNVINTAGVQHPEQQQIVAERISSILASSPHEQQQTTISQTPIQIKRAWPMNQHQQSGDNHFLGRSISSQQQQQIHEWSNYQQQ
ncbi:unnamed protein product, partial [Rotaria sordida]